MTNCGHEGPQQCWCLSRPYRVAACSSQLLIEVNLAHTRVWCSHLLGGRLYQSTNWKLTILNQSLLSNSSNLVSFAEIKCVIEGSLDFVFETSLGGWSSRNCRETKSSISENHFHTPIPMYFADPTELMALASVHISRQTEMGWFYWDDRMKIPQQDALWPALVCFLQLIKAPSFWDCELPLPSLVSSQMGWSYVWC